MPFTIDYGPISTAMNLAQQGGQAQAAQTGFTDQVALSQHLLQSQQAAASQRAQEISLALENQRNQNTQQLAMAQMQNEQAYRQQYLGGLNNYRQGTLGVRQDQAGIQQQRANQQGQYQNSIVGIDQNKQNSLAQYQQWEQQHGDAIANIGAAKVLDDTIKTKLQNGMDATNEFQQLQGIITNATKPHNKPQQTGGIPPDKQAWQQSLQSGQSQVLPGSAPQSSNQGDQGQNPHGISVNSPDDLANVPPNTIVQTPNGTFLWDGQTLRRTQ